MVYELSFSRSQWQMLRSHLLWESSDAQHRADEQLAFMLAGPSQSERGLRLVVRELLLASAADLDFQGAVGIRPTPEFVARALTRCRQEGWSLIEAHSHPFDSSMHTSFSGVDWGSDRAKMPAIATLLPDGAAHVTTVFGQRSFDAHYFKIETGEILPVEVVTVIGAMGERFGVERLKPTGLGDAPFQPELRHARQIPFLGDGTQANLQKATVVIVGLGGLGSFAALELAHLGVGRLGLIDADTIEETNLNRLVGAGPADVGKPKVDFYAELIKHVAPDCQIDAVQASILDDVALAVAKGGDLLLGCVDSHGARLVLNHLAVQYRIPLVDAGTGVQLAPSASPMGHKVGGQVQAVMPDIGCLQCRGFIDARRAAFDLAPPEMQEYETERGYGTGQPAPSVVHLNAIVASMQVAMTLELLSAGQPGLAAPVTMFNAVKPSLTPVLVHTDDDCPTCGLESIAGLADLSPLGQAELRESNMPSLVSPE